jgi:hypothetical protein
MPLDKGTRVYIKSLNVMGTINYARMRAPTYSEVDVYSVQIDGRNHAGTIVQASDVEEVPF